MYISLKQKDTFIIIYTNKINQYSWSDYSGDLKSSIEIRTFSRSDFKLALAIPLVPTIQKLDHSKSGQSFDKMAPICPDFKWLGFWI